MGMPGSSAPFRRLARSSIAAFATYMIGAGLTYCSQLLIARIIGASSYGIYAYVFAWMTVMAYLAALGFDVSLLRLVPTYRALGAWRLLRGVIQYAESRAATVGVGVALIGVGIVLLGSGPHDLELTKTFLVGLALIPIWALLWIRSSIVRAFGGVVSVLAPDRVVRDGLLLGLIGLASLTGRWKIEAWSAMLATVASSAVGLVLVSLAAQRWRPRRLDNVVPEYTAASWRRSALPLVLIAVAETAMNRMGVVLLGWAGQTREAGIYALAFNIASLVVLPRMAVNALFAPMVSDLFARNDRAALQATIAKTSAWTLLSAACIALPLVLIAGPFLAWFGRDFGAGIPTMGILLFGQVIAAGAGSQLFLLTMTGHERAAAVMLILSAAFNAVLSTVLIGRLGLTGAALATAASLILWNVGMAAFTWRKLKLVPGVLAVFGAPLGSPLGATTDIVAQQGDPAE